MNQTNKKINNLDFTRVNQDVYGNPRYVIHYLAFSDEYDEALSIAKKLGFKEYRAKHFGGGFVITTYCLYDVIKKANLILSNSECNK